MLYFVENCQLPAGFLESGDIALLDLGLTELQCSRAVWEYRYEDNALKIESVAGLVEKLAAFGSAKEVGNG